MQRALHASSLLLILIGWLCYRATGVPLAFLLGAGVLALCGYSLRRRPAFAVFWWMPAIFLVICCLVYHHRESWVHPGASTILAAGAGLFLASHCYLLQKRAEWNQQLQLPETPAERRFAGKRLYGASPFFFGAVIIALAMQWQTMFHVSRSTALLLSLVILVLSAIVWETARLSSRREGVRVQNLGSSPPKLHLALWLLPVLLYLGSWLLYTRALPPVAERLSVVVVRDQGVDTLSPSLNDDGGLGNSGANRTLAPDGVDSATSDDTPNPEIDSSANGAPLNLRPRKPSLWEEFLNRVTREGVAQLGAVLGSLILAVLILRQFRKKVSRDAADSEGDNIEVDFGDDFPQPKYLRELCRLGEGHGIPRRSGDTVREYIGHLATAGLVDRGHFDRLSRYYCEVRYGGASVDRSEERRIWETLHAWKRERPLPGR